MGGIKMRRRQRPTVGAVLGGGLFRLLLAVGVLVTLFSGLSACAKRDVTHLAEGSPPYS